METWKQEALLEMSRKTLTLHLSKRMDMTLRVSDSPIKKRETYELRISPFTTQLSLRLTAPRETHHSA